MVSEPNRRLDVFFPWIRGTFMLNVGFILFFSSFFASSWFLSLQSWSLDKFYDYFSDLKLSFCIKFIFLRFLLVFGTKSSSFIHQILVFGVKVSTFIAIYYFWVKFGQKELVLIKFGSKIWSLKKFLLVYA